jgi:2-polyprenyl-3-methyl-5-hydroxy-6-metoxy-1,4-benzoquinol methylase
MPGADVRAPLRDTDADWRALGATEPYWGVLTMPDFRSENITPEGLETFYLGGRQNIDQMVQTLVRLTGEAPSGAALDFGCGVGRLSEAMADHVPRTTGYDISPGMLERARARRGKATYVDVLPDGPFDWISSLMVFQHIPPDRGLTILEDLMARLAPRGMISLHLTVWREPHLEVTAAGWRKLLLGWRWRRRVRKLPVGHIMMYDYDLSQVLRVLNRAGVEEMQLASTDHGGHHGVIIYGRKTAEPHQS